MPVSTACDDVASCRLRAFRAGVADIAAPCLAMIPIGLLFGAVAASKNLSAVEVGAMSALVFAGGAQFAALEIWTSPVPLAAVLVSTLLINARHVLMSASLAVKADGFAPWQRVGCFFFLADEIWAFAERRAGETRLTPAYMMGLALPLWLGWLVWTTLGALVGARLGEPERFGADFAFTALFIGLIASLWRGPATGIAVGASGLAATGAWLVLGSPWHVLAGALAGVAGAAAAHRERGR